MGTRQWDQERCAGVGRTKNRRLFFTMVVKAVRAMSNEVSKKKVRRTMRRNELDTSMLEEGGAQRSCGDAYCVVRSLTQRQLHGTQQAGIDPEAETHLHHNAEHIAEGREKQVAKRMQLDATR